MIEQDYIIRMITVLSRFLARVLSLKRSRDFPAALVELKKAGKTLVGLDPSLVARLSVPQLMTLFGADRGIAMPKSYVLGILLKEESDVRRQMGEEGEADRVGAAALALLVETYLAGGEGIVPRHADAIEETQDALRGSALPPDLVRSLFAYEELRGRYDRAENLLYDIVDVDGGFAAQGVRFYERLLERSDEQLVRGNLPRAEVREGLEKLRSRLSADAPLRGDTENG